MYKRIVIRISNGKRVGASRDISIAKGSVPGLTAALVIEYKLSPAVVDKQLRSRKGRVKNLPDIPVSLRNYLDNAFASKPKYYSLLAKFLTKELDIQAWELLHLHGQKLRKFDERLLTQLSKLLSKQYFLQKVGDINGLMDIVKANAAAPCCGSMDGVRKTIDKYLLEMEKYVTDYQHLTGNGFESLIRDMKNPSHAMQEGVNHAVDILTRKPPHFDPQKVKKFDFVFDTEGIDCSTCKFDVEMVRPLQPEPKWIKYYEFKSYKDASKIQFNQFKSYLQSIENLEELRYIFDAGKLFPEQAKEGIQTIFKAKAEQLFNANPELFKRLKTADGMRQLSDWEDLYELANSGVPVQHNPLFHFIEAR